MGLNVFRLKQFGAVEVAGMTLKTFNMMDFKLKQRILNRSLISQTVYFLK